MTIHRNGFWRRATELAGHACNPSLPTATEKGSTRNPAKRKMNTFDQGKALSVSSCPDQTFKEENSRVCACRGQRYPAGPARPVAPGRTLTGSPVLGQQRPAGLPQPSPLPGQARSPCTPFPRYVIRDQNNGAAVTRRRLRYWNVRSRGTLQNCLFWGQERRFGFALSKTLAPPGRPLGFLLGLTSRCEQSEGPNRPQAEETPSATTPTPLLRR